MITDLAWFIPLMPFLGFLINGLGYKNIPKNLVGVIGCGTVAISFILTLIFFVYSLTAPEPIIIQCFTWIKAGKFEIPFSLLIDRLSIMMMMIVTGVGLLIHIYSIGYMKEDAGYSKFFAYLNLFMFSMLLLVMASNYVVMFIGWEGVGLCSYLLIGFWFKNSEYMKAANKAFIMNRIGDLGFLLGIFLIFLTFGSVQFVDVFHGASTFSAGDTTIVAITLLLFIGAMGKSAQIPLYTWLPDAMAGPTPVSALIHAATMVTAGIYMIARSNILYSLAPFTLTIITIIGTATALLAALIAMSQTDIKKVLAYSTVSQLGYMFVALGMSAYSTAMFHLMTHAFFKALLFLGAGSVIHAMSGEQNIKKMGGLKKFLPVTYFTCLIATLAISGFPPFSGFFSKDEILMTAYSQSSVIFILLSVTSVLTAIYMFRMFFLVFTGKFRGTFDQEHHLHESPTSMTFPLIILAVLSAVGGFAGIPHIFSHKHLLNNFLDPVFSSNARIFRSEPPAFAEYALIMGTIVIVGAVMYLLYKKYAIREVHSHEVEMSFLEKLSYHKFYVDEIYDFIVVKPLNLLSTGFYNVVEKSFIDKIVNRSGEGVVNTGTVLRNIQTGNAGFYVLVMVVGIVSMVLYGLYKMNYL